MIFFDNAATTPMSEVVKKTIIDNLDNYANPSSSYEFARRSRLAIEDARKKIAKYINAQPMRSIFAVEGQKLMR